MSEISIYFSDTLIMESSLVNSMLRTIQAKGRGAVFTPNDFWKLGSRSSIDQGLTRLVKRGMIRRLARGVYDYPRTNRELGISAYPSVEQIAKAITKSHGARIQISGAYAANVLGLSTQVPARVVYLTDGYSKRVTLGKQTLIFRRASPKVMRTAGRLSGTVIQALKHLGQEAVTPAMVRQLRRVLKADSRELMLRDLKYAPVWIRNVIKQVLSTEGVGRG